MKGILLSLIVLSSFIARTQTWSGEVAQLFYNKCTSCHHTGGIAPTPFTTYSETSPLASTIATYVASGYMPPWPPSNTYQQYIHNRALSPSEKSTILTWIGLGTPEGNPSETPPAPIYSNGAILGPGDLEVKMPTYMSKAQVGADDYVCFSVPSGLAENRTIKSIEIIPGNRHILHHALIYIDPAGNEVTDSIGGNCASPSDSNTTLVSGYTPGASPLILPSTSPLKLGISITAGSNIYFGMHYPAGSYGQFDSTKVIFHFYPANEMDIREIYAAPGLQNWTFTLPPNEITPVNATYGPIPINASVLSVFPHMHLLGKSIKAYGITPSLDTIKFAYLPKWDFHWQGFYFFKNIVFAPIGTILKGEGLYDNTSANPNNPNNPPITVYPGLNTTDEMFLVYFHFMFHQPGDEKYDMEALMNAAYSNLIKDKNSPISISPNPFSDGTNISFEAKEGDKLSVYIYDSQGNIVSKILSNSTVNSKQVHLTWDGTDEESISVRKGVYFVSINLNGKFFSQRLIKF